MSLNLDTPQVSHHRFLHSITDKFLVNKNMNESIRIFQKSFLNIMELCIPQNIARLDSDTVACRVMIRKCARMRALQVREDDFTGHMSLHSQCQPVMRDPREDYSRSIFCVDRIGRKTGF